MPANMTLSTFAYSCAVADGAGQGTHVAEDLHRGTTAGCSPWSSTAPHVAQRATAGASAPTNVLSSSAMSSDIYAYALARPRRGCRCTRACVAAGPGATAATLCATVGGLCPHMHTDVCMHTQPRMSAGSHARTRALDPAFALCNRVSCGRLREWQGAATLWAPQCCPRCVFVRTCACRHSCQPMWITVDPHCGIIGTHMHTHIQASTNVCRHACLRISVHTSTHACGRVSMCARARVCIRVCGCVCA